VSQGPARIIVLGRSKNRSKKINNFLSEIFTQEIPAEFVSTVTLRYDNGTESQIKNIENDIIIEDLNWILKKTDVDRVVEEIEIIVELDVIQNKITSQANTLLNKYFTDE
jgi:hypothetical protein|tara:strand:+ start:2349 stop:2678 length:330 start_codon:yes stop_codon:yes gene_type:complete